MTLATLKCSYFVGVSAEAGHIVFGSLAVFVVFCALEVFVVLGSKA